MRWIVWNTNNFSSDYTANQHMILIKLTICKCKHKRVTYVLYAFKSIEIHINYQNSNRFTKVWYHYMAYYVVKYVNLYADCSIQM